jgi:hypothetical protein
LLVPPQNFILGAECRIGENSLESRFKMEGKVVKMENILVKKGKMERMEKLP